MDLGAKLQSVRLEKGISTSELAQALEIEEEAIIKWENNQSTPNAGELMNLSKIYKMSIDKILYDGEEAPQYDESKAVYAKPDINVENNQEADNAPSEKQPEKTVSTKKSKKKMTASEKMTLMVFPFFCGLVYLFLGICLKVWHPTWILLLLIPFYFGLYFILRGIGNRVDKAVDEYVTEEENNENNH